MREFTRRDLTKALGATLILPGFVRGAMAAGPNPGPRLLILMQANGVHQPAFWPANDDLAKGSVILDPLLKDPVLRAKTTLIKGLYLNLFEGNAASDPAKVDNRDDALTRGLLAGAGDHHDHGSVGLWSGVAPISGPIGGGTSIDQLLKQKLNFDEPFPTMNCGVRGPLRDNTACRDTFSYLAPGKKNPVQWDIYKSYAQFFSGGSIPSAGANPAATVAMLAQEKSVLDHVAKQLTTLSGRLGVNERRKLEFHTTSLREFEKRLSILTTRPDTMGCMPSAPKGGIDPLGTKNENDIPTLVDLTFDLITNVLACRRSRIITYMFGITGNMWTFPFLGINVENHRAIAHMDTGPYKSLDESTWAPEQRVAAGRMKKIGGWYAGKVASLASKLDAVKEADGNTLLDNSLLVWSNELAVGPHGLDNLPLVMCGKAGGRLKTLGKVVQQGRQPHHRLGVTVQNLMGHDSRAFGSMPDAGPLAGVDIAG